MEGARTPFAVYRSASGRSSGWYDLVMSTIARARDRG